MKNYRVTIGGTETVLQLTDEDAAARGYTSADLDKSKALEVESPKQYDDAAAQAAVDAKVAEAAANKQAPAATTKAK